ncbi:MAG TPA: ABC transporter permease subunit [Acidimicrobiales bacterium]|nr:ABC transporter permease subunit [Acidimicrobiales bacterium]
MNVTRPFSGRLTLDRPRVSGADLVVGAGIAVLLYVVLRLGPSLNTSRLSAHITATVSTAPSNLPYYAARSLLRMFIALFISVVFTFVYGTAAARSRRARIVLIPLLDILQSVPVLGFLTVTVTFFVSLFPRSILGLECASIFAIFTSQAWNMTFSFYHSLMAQPEELDEAARLFRLTKWQRFWKLDVPGSMIGLVWNGMMSFGGGWFFLAASEAITVSGHTLALPGLGSYVAAAIQAGSLSDVCWAIVVMVVLVVGVNVVFWRPLVAWAEKFRFETSEPTDRPRSLTLGVLRRSHVPALLGRSLKPVARGLDRATRPFGLAEHPLHAAPSRRRAGDIVFAVVVGAVIAYGVYRGGVYLQQTVGFGQFPRCLYLGLLTFLRVIVLLAFSTVIWVPIGVKIGMTPRLARYAQPVVQVLASFPANFLFPFATVIFVAVGLSLDIGGVFLMALGAQWYILFNTIAGASAIPTELREMAAQFRLPRRQRWRQVILPAVFPAFVTGGITAAGGAWNASIVAEVVNFGEHHLVANGLGAYITEATAAGSFAKVLVGVVVMSFYVVVVNRLLWRPLYALAERRYSM